MGFDSELIHFGAEGHRSQIDPSFQQLLEKVALGKLSIRYGKTACFNDRI